MNDTNTCETSHLLIQDIESQTRPASATCSQATFWNQRWASSRETRDAAVQGIKYGYSVLLLGLCIRSVMMGIFKGVTPISQASGPIAAFAFMWLLIIWLGVLEGGQGSLVGLQPIPRDAYARTHSHSYRCTELAHAGNNINRFILGRQFFVVLVIYCVNLCCTVVDGAEDAETLSRITLVFLESGIAVMIITVILGQLSTEVNATRCMLDFINTPAMYATTWLCLAIESSGLLHSVYLIPKIIRWFSSRKKESEEAEACNIEDKSQSGWLFWIRVMCSTVIVSYAMVATFVALWHDETTMYKGTSKAFNILIFILLIAFLGMLEAMQIALFAVVNLPETDLHGHNRAVMNYRLAFEGKNFQAFLIGRQICVTMCMFLLARITTTEIDTDHLAVGSSTVLSMPDGLQQFFNTGLPGALCTTVIASLMWRIVASTFPIAFMDNPLVFPTIHVCLLLERTGVFSASWLLARVVKTLCGLKDDVWYLEQAGEFPGKAAMLSHQETDSLSDSASTQEEDTFASLSLYGTSSSSSSMLDD